VGRLGLGARSCDRI